MAVITGTSAEADSARIRLAASGDQVAFAAIVAEYHEDMRRVCAVVTGNDQITDEAVEAAWSIAWLKLGSVRDPSRLRAWLVSVAINEARQLLRARRRRAVLEIAMPIDDERHSVADPQIGIHGIDLRNALQKLDPADRALVAMRYLIGFDATELAHATGRSPSGTRARLSRLLNRLQRELGDE